MLKCMNIYLKFMQKMMKSSLNLTSEKNESAVVRLRSYLKSGQVYRREDLLSASNAVDRHLKLLVNSGDLEKLSQGLYYAPKLSIFGKVPPKDKDLVRVFLKEEDFLLFSPNSYNSLGLGTTQLYSKTIVYNRKRHGVFKLGNRNFDFRMKPRFPKKLDREFLLIDLLNNLDALAENINDILVNAEKQIAEFEPSKLKKAVSDYGAVGTKKKVLCWLQIFQEANT